MRYLLLIGFLICLTANAQKKLAIPDTGEFMRYLYARQHAIEEKLYNLALSGTIKAYMTDSLHTAYSKAELARRGTTELVLWVQTNPNDPTEGYDSIIQTPFSVDKINGIWFLRSAEPNCGGKSGKQNYEGITLAYAPVFRNIQTLPHPLFWISFDDLKANLTSAEMEFLETVFYYSYNSNQMEEFWSKYRHHDDPFDILNQMGNTSIIVDSLLYLKIASMLSFSNFYVPDQIYKQDPVILKKARIYDQQKLKLINLDSFNKTYTQRLTTWIQTNPDDPTEGRDTAFFIPYGLGWVESLSLDEKTGKPTKYNLIANASLPDQPSFRFSLDIDPSYKPVKNILWFYEDYIRWKGL